MTVKSRILPVFKALALCLLFVSSQVLAQNNLLPTNVSNFNIGTVGNGHSGNNLNNAGVTTSYSYVSWENGLLADGATQCYAVGTNARYYGNGHNGIIGDYGLFNLGDHTTGNGNYMIVNGSTSSNKKVWEYTVQNISPGVIYQFKAYVTCLFMTPYGTQPTNNYLPKLQLKINDQDVGPVKTINWANGGEWTLWSEEWIAGSNTTSAKITIIDNCTNDNGNDFGLDDIYFAPNTVYSVTTQPDNYSACLNGITIEMNVLANDIFNPAPDQYTYLEVLTPLNQIPGTVTVDHNTNIIYYTFNDASYTGTTTDFQYQVTFHGLTYDNWIHVLLNRAPDVGVIQALDEPICDGFPLGINVPSVAPNAQGYWEISPTGSAPWFQLQNPNSIGLEYNNYYVRYTASNDNDCGPNSSNAVQIHVVSAPTAPTIYSPDPICEGPNAAFDLPTIPPGNNGYSGGWLIADNPNGPFVSFTNANITYNNHNGRYICYFVQNDCGGPFNSNAVQLTVNAAPIVPNITAPAGVCEGQSLVLTPPSNIQWRHNDPNTCFGWWQVYLDGAWQDIPGNSIPSISYDTYNGCHIRYKAHNGCDDGYSNEVAITVYSTQPVDLGDVTFCQEGYFHGVWCSQDGHEYGYDSLTPNNCTIHVSWLFHLSEDYNTHPQTQTECDEFYWPQTGITYHNSGIYNDTVPNPNPVECDDIYTLDLTINHAPVITEQLESPNPIEVCSSIGNLNVTAPAFENGGTSYWEYATSENGPWNDDGFDPTAFNLDYGSYWLRRAAINDCTDEPVTSNPVRFYVSEPPVISIVSGQMPDSICAGDILDLPVVTVDFRNKDQVGGQQWQMADSQEGPYWLYPAMPIDDDCWIQYIAQNSCGIDTLGPVHVSVISVDDQYPDPILGCDTVWFDGNYYMRDTVIDRVIGDFCQYTIHNSIVVNHSDRPETNPDLIEEVTWCHDEYFWHGRTYYRSDDLQVDRWYTSNIHGCDSIRELRLRFGTANEIWNNNQFGCDSYTWHVNDTTSYTYYYDEDQPHILDTVFIPGVGDDCDTYYYLDLIMGKIWEASESPCDTIPICSGEDYNGVFYSEDIIVYDTLSASTHCDSIVSRYLSIIQPIETTDSIANCVLPYMWYSQDQYHLFVEDGEEHTASLTSLVTGCDSIVTIHFELTDKIETTFSADVCEPFSWYGHTFNGDETWSHTFTTPEGCDSTVYLNVSFIQTDTLIDEPISACNSYTFEGNDYLPGFYPIYYDTVFAPNGCIRSVQLLNLTVKDSEQVGTINGASNVYVASSLISGIYRYEIDTEGLAGPATWSLSNPDWQIIEQGDDFCRVFVSTPGNATLTAHFNVEECGEMERSFEINAVFYGVDDYQGVDVHIFPNPTKGSVTIETEGIESLRLIDMMGQVLETREYDRSDSVTLNLSTYTPSVYLFEIKTVYGVVKKRLILCR